MMRFVVMVLLVVVVLPYAYGHYGHLVDAGQQDAGRVCVSNLRAGAVCEPADDAQQVMVLVRGQLLPVR